MRNRISNVFSTAMSEVSLFIVVCCMVVSSLTSGGYGEWTDAAVASALFGGAVLVAFLVWATCKIIADKPLKEMPPHSLIVFEVVNRVLLLCWLWTASSLTMALVWLPFIAWTGIRSVRGALGAAGKDVE